MMCSVRERLADWSPAIFVGYNSIGFDEHMLRHGFFQSLHDAYLTSNPAGGRADALGLALTASALPPHCIKAPLSDTGRPIFKLEAIARANDLVHDKAHDALSDVDVTLSLCRLIRDRSTDVWQRFVRFSKKASVDQFIEAEDGFVLTEFFGNEAYHRPVALLGPEPRNSKNGRFCIGLSIDPEQWAAMSDDDIRAEVCRKGGPMRRLAINGAPTLTAIWDAPEMLLDGIEADVAEDRARRFKDAPDLCARLIEVYTASWTDGEASPHPEDRLYSDRFPCDDDKYRMSSFHEASRKERLEIVAAFEDPRLQTFGRRLIHSNHRSWLSDEAKLQEDLDLADRITVERGGALTLGSALAHLDKLVADGADDPLALLPSYRIWLAERIARIDEFRARHLS
jgi:exodeoxyribonuclease-1